MQGKTTETIGPKTKVEAQNLINRLESKGVSTVSGDWLNVWSYE
jgi:hypothetical protein